MPVKRPRGRWMYLCAHSPPSFLLLERGGNGESRREKNRERGSIIEESERDKREGRRGGIRDGGLYRSERERRRRERRRREGIGESEKRERERGPEKTKNLKLRKRGRAESLSEGNVFLKWGNE